MRRSARLWMLLAAAPAVLAALGCAGSPNETDGTEDPLPAPVPGLGWGEPDWCADLASLEALEAAHDGSALRDTLLGLSDLRYPPGRGFIDAQSDGELETWFFGASDDFEAVVDGFEVAVHEGSHIWGFGRFDFDTYSYRVVDDGRIVVTVLLENFDRSEILTRHPDPASDLYAPVYLEGSSGAQGFNTLLDEYNAYTHSLVTRYCTRDALGGGSTSARDGILTMMWYVGLYLQIAREEHPDDYEAIVGDPGHVELILAVWDRAEHWLAVTAPYDELGLDDAAIAERTYDPAIVAEIERVRTVAQD